MKGRLMLSSDVYRHRERFCFLSRWLILALLTAASTACEKDDEPARPGPQEPAAPAYDAVHIHGKVLHHAREIPLAEVYYKVDALAFPGADPEAYDHQVQADSTGAFHLHELPVGDYYFYGRGWDDGIHDSVFGGIPVIISGDSASMHLHLPVTE